MVDGSEHALSHCQQFHPFHVFNVRVSSADLPLTLAVYGWERTCRRCFHGQSLLSAIAMSSIASGTTHMSGNPGLRLAWCAVRTLLCSVGAVGTRIVGVRGTWTTGRMGGGLALPRLMAGGEGCRVLSMTPTRCVALSICTCGIYRWVWLIR